MGFTKKFFLKVSTISLNCFKIKKNLFLLLFSFAAILSTFGEPKKIKLSFLKDSVFLGAGLLYALTSELFINTLDFNLPQNLQKDDINFFDELAIFPYSKQLDRVGDILQYVAFLSPGALIFYKDFYELINLGIVYSESVLFAFGTKNFLKFLIERPRPYLYFDSPPTLEENDYLNSLPSGHTTIAFTAAAFTTFSLYYYNPDSFWNIPISLMSFGIATGTAIFRVLSGNHFLTDVVLGALIGTTCGIIFPYLHIDNRLKKDNKVEVMLLPSGFKIKIHI